MGNIVNKKTTIQFGILLVSQQKTSIINFSKIYIILSTQTKIIFKT